MPASRPPVPPDAAPLRGPASARKSAFLRFLVLFPVLAFAFSLLVRLDTLLLDEALGRSFVRGVTRVVGAAMRVAGAPVARQENTLYYGSGQFQVVTACTGIDLIALFVAAVVSFPRSWRQRTRILVVGVSVLAALNVIRIMSLVYVGTRWPEALEFGHLYVWPTLLLVASLGLWLRWVLPPSRD